MDIVSQINMNTLTIILSALTLSLLILSIPLITYAGFVAHELEKQKNNSWKNRKI